MRKKIIGVLILCLILVGATACEGLGGGGETAPQEADVVRGDLSVIVSGSGAIELSEEANLFFNGVGKIERVFVAERDSVNKGDAIAKLDTSADHLTGILNAETEQKAQRIINNVDHASADFRSLTASLGEVKDAAGDLVNKLDGMVSDAHPDLKQTIRELRSIMERVSHYSEGILHNLDSTSRNVSEFSRQIRENPGRLIGGAVSGDPGVRRE